MRAALTACSLAMGVLGGACAGAAGVDGGPVARDACADCARDAGPSDAGPSCVAAESTARPAMVPVDMVWAVDFVTAQEEADLVTENLAALVNGADTMGVDLRVVLIGQSHIVQIAAPLSQDPEHMLRIAGGLTVAGQVVDALGAIVLNYPMYETYLRPDASLSFVTVTLNDALMTADEFDAEIRARIGRDYVLHTISSPPGSEHCSAGVPCAPTSTDRMEGCVGPYGYAFANADTQWELAERTGGVARSICDTQSLWLLNFRDLTNAVAVPVPVPCAWEVPSAPPGKFFDPAVFSLGLPDGRSIARADQDLPCTGEAWQLDPGTTRPRRVVLCSDACEAVTPGTTLDVVFGCPP